MFLSAAQENVALTSHHSRLIQAAFEATTAADVPSKHHENVDSCCGQIFITCISQPTDHKRDLGGPVVTLEEECAGVKPLVHGHFKLLHFLSFGIFCSLNKSSLDLHLLTSTFTCS